MNGAVLLLSWQPQSKRRGRRRVGIEGGKKTAKKGGGREEVKEGGREGIIRETQFGHFWMQGHGTERGGSLSSNGSDRTSSMFLRRSGIPACPCFTLGTVFVQLQPCSTAVWGFTPSGSEFIERPPCFCQRVHICQVVFRALFINLLQSHLFPRGHVPRLCLWQDVTDKTRKCHDT